jgi:ADP-heptose:LPS heptosyltransferase
VITLSNIGDVILTTPVVDALKKNFPQAKISLLVGPRAKEVFANDGSLRELIIYDKQLSVREKFKLIALLRSRKFDLVIDLRNTLFPLFLGARYKTSSLGINPDLHQADRHLRKLAQLGIEAERGAPYFSVPQEAEDYAKRIWQEFNLSSGLVVAIAPGAKSHTKRWTEQGFCLLAKKILSEKKAMVIFVGDEQDKEITGRILAQLKEPAIDLTGKTNLSQLAAILKRCNLLITNDSAPMHLAWALGVPVVAIFGPTDWQRYAPRSKNCIVIRKELACAPCKKALCRFQHECMQLVSADDVFQAAAKFL